MHRLSFKVQLALVTLLLLQPQPSHGQGLTHWRTGDPLVVGAGSGIEFGTVGGVEVLHSGIVAVADQLMNEVYFFSPAGELLARRGRKGRGPEEYEMLIWAGECGTDTLLVLDGWNVRVDTYTSGGRLLADAPPPSLTAGRAPRAMACVGRTLFALEPAGLPSQRVPGPYRTRSAIIMRGSGADSVIAQIPSNERYLLPSLRSIRPRPMGARTLLTSAAGHLIIGVGDERELRRFDPDGKQLKPIPIPWESAPVTGSDVSGFIEHEVRSARSEDQRRRWRSELEDYEWPERHPYFLDLIGSPTGEIWLLRAAPPVREVQRWMVLSPEGSPRAWVELPMQYRLMKVLEDRLVAVYTDPDFGVQSVHVLPLLRPSR
jgi:hypothetical protein